MSNAIAIWVLSLFHILQPASPWVDTYGESANAIAQASNDSPATAAVLVAIAWDQSRFNPAALGDCKKDAQGQPILKVGACQSLGIFQISKWWAPSKILLNPSTAAPKADWLVAESSRMCAKRPEVDKLGWYAAGLDGCRGLTDSRRIMRLAQRILREHPFDLL